MGTILCTPSQKYTVVYNSTRKSWIVTGYHEGHEENRTFEYNNGNVEEYEMSLWGSVFTFNESGAVFDPEYGKVGKIITK